MQDFPWNMPVPVKSSTFQSLFPKHKEFNIEVNLSGISPFSYDLKPRKPKDLLYVDCQTNLDVNIDKRLGSGRSGFFLDKYVKGIGRTLLAANWNTDKDLYHSNGALLSSAAVREYLISCYVNSLGKGHLINPCEGILLRKIPYEKGNLPFNIFKGNLKRHGVKRHQFASIDCKFQAISIKQGNFCRFSNIVWWLNNYPQYSQDEKESSLGHFFEVLYRSLSGFNDRSTKGIRAEDIAQSLGDTFEITIEFFMQTWASGIDWGSYHNNFTIDGRYLDLETPNVFPFPLFGIISNTFGAKKIESKLTCTNFENFNCFRVLLYVKQARLFVHFLNKQLGFMATHGLCNDKERFFIQDFLESLNALLKNHPLTSPEALYEIIFENVIQTLELSGRQPVISKIVEGAISALSANRKHRNKKKISLHLVKIPDLANAEPCMSPSLYVPDFIGEQQMRISQRAVDYNRYVKLADSMTDIDDLFEFLTSSVAKWSKKNEKTVNGKK